MTLKDIVQKRKKDKDMKNDPMKFLLEEITKLSGELETVKKKLEDEEFELELDGNDFSHIRGDDGNKGDKGDIGVQGLQGRQGNRGKKGDKGSRGQRGPGGEAGVQGDKGNTGNIGESGENIAPEEIIKRVNSLKESVNLEAVNGLEKRLRSIELLIQDTARESKGKKVGGGGEIIESHDLTAECDGATKVFTIPENRNVIGVFSTQFPVNYRPLIDWTISGRTLTLTSEVGAPQTGQTLWVLFKR